jgi:integrase/recombinase XerD
MMRAVLLSRAVDLYLGDCARRGLAHETRRTYRRILWALCDALPNDTFVSDVQPVDCEHFVDRWQDSAASTLRLSVTAVKGLFAYLIREGHLEKSPAATLQLPRRLRPEDVDVVTVKASDVMALFRACGTWQEFLCVSVAVFLGPRRRAISRARLRDVDFERGTIRFREKGGKVAIKPMPDQLVMILELAREQGVWATQDDYLVPNRRPARNPERSHKVIYDTVRKVADRAGVRAHVHALRAAFAVQYLETHEGDLEALKHLLGHARYETTEVYLRRLNRSRSMERVRDLSWGAVLPPYRGMPPAGFEPALPESAAGKPKSGDAERLIPDVLRAKLEELRKSGNRERT